MVSLPAQWHIAGGFFAYRMVDDLHRLLNYASNQPKPLLLVSVDYSTFIARFYTQLYEQLVTHLQQCYDWGLNIRLFALLSLTAVM